MQNSDLIRDKELIKILIHLLENQTQINKQLEARIYNLEGACKQLSEDNLISDKVSKTNDYNKRLKAWDKRLRKLMFDSHIQSIQQDNEYMKQIEILNQAYEEENYPTDVFNDSLKEIKMLNS